MRTTHHDTATIFGRLVGRTLYAVRRRSTWAGVGAVDQIDQVFANRDEAERYCERQETREGLYGDVYSEVDELTCPQSIATLWAEGAEYDPETDRVWIGSNCVAARWEADVVEYRNRQQAKCRRLTAAEAEYLTGCWLAIVGRNVREFAQDGTVIGYQDD